MKPIKNIILSFAIIVLSIILFSSYKIDSNQISVTNHLISLLNINISVKTNVDCFTCNYKSSTIDSSRLKLNVLNNNYFIKNGIEVIPIKEIECQNRLMNEDLQEMLNVRNNPYIKIEIINFSNNTTEKNLGTGSIVLNINETSKLYNLNLNNYKKDDNLFISGKLEVNLNDYGIVPPTKFFGLVKVENLIEIDFVLLFNLSQKITDTTY